VASRAESVARAAGPAALGGTVRRALTDFYFNSLRLVPLNVVWGTAVVMVVLVGLAAPLLAIVLSPLLAIPTAATFRMAAAIVRDEPFPTVRESLPGAVAQARPALVLGTAVVLALLILGTNILAGLGGSEPIGWIIATLAAWGLVVIWCGAIAVWPLLADPRRADRGLRDDLRLAGILVLAEPIRLGALGLLVAIIVAVSTILTAALLTIGVAFVALLACRTVYPVADRLDPPAEEPTS
jgi:hypothetical protein